MLKSLWKSYNEKEDARYIERRMKHYQEIEYYYNLDKEGKKRSK